MCPSGILHFSVVDICVHNNNLNHHLDSRRTYPYYYNPVLKRKQLQPFTPCQLRFLVVLFIDRWLLLGTTALMGTILIKNISDLASAISIPKAHVCVPVVEHNQQHHQQKFATVVASNNMDAVEVTESPHQQQQQQDVAAMFKLAQKAAAAAHNRHTS